MQHQIIDIDYTVDYKSPIIRLWCRGDDGDSHVIRVPDMVPYFYALPATQDDELISRAKHKISLWPVVKDVVIVERFIPVGYQTKRSKMIKIVTTLPRHVRDIRDRLSILPEISDIFEADILFKNRFMVDNGLSGMDWVDDNGSRVDRDGNAVLRYMALDIEVLPPEDGTFPSAENDPVIIVSLEFYPYYEKKKSIVIAENSEVVLFRKLFNIFYEYDPDFVMGYNINGFDFPYLDGRCRKLGIFPGVGKDRSPWRIDQYGNDTRTTIRGRVVVDLLPLARSAYSLRRYNLGTVASEILNTNKLDVKASDMRELWSTDRNRFVEYARRDAELVMQLAIEERLIDRHIALARRSGVLIQDAIQGGQSIKIDSLILRAFRDNGRVMGRKPTQDEASDRENEKRWQGGITGAIVLDPRPGLFEKVIVLDYQSLYPSVMMGNNICFTTLCSDGSFVPRDQEIGVIPSILESLFDERVKLKQSMKTMDDGPDKDYVDARQYALKILLNSFYGYTGYTRSRLYDTKVASAVTRGGRDALMHAIKITKDHPTLVIDGIHITTDVLYSDTDSVMIALDFNGHNFINTKTTHNTWDVVAEKVSNTIAEMVTKELPHPMKLVHEDIFDRAVFLAKKRYAMKRPDGSMKVRGLETRRRDFCPLATQTMEEVLNIILTDGDPIKAMNHVNGVVTQVDQIDTLSPDDELVNDLTLTKVLSRKLSEYKNPNLAHLNVVRQLEKSGNKVSVGDRVAYLIVPGSTKSNLSQRAKPVEWVFQHGDGKIDKGYYIKTQIIPPVLRLLSIFGISKRELLVPQQQKRLFDF